MPRALWWSWGGGGAKFDPPNNCTLLESKPYQGLSFELQQAHAPPCGWQENSDYMRGTPTLEVELRI